MEKPFDTEDSKKDDTTVSTSTDAGTKEADSDPSNAAASTSTAAGTAYQEDVAEDEIDQLVKVSLAVEAEDALKVSGKKRLEKFPNFMRAEGSKDPEYAVFFRYSGPFTEVPPISDEALAALQAELGIDEPEPEESLTQSFSSVSIAEPDPVESPTPNMPSSSSASVESDDAHNTTKQEETGSDGSC